MREAGFEPANSLGDRLLKPAPVVDRNGLYLVSIRFGLPLTGLGYPRLQLEAYRHRLKHIVYCIDMLLIPRYDSVYDVSS